MSNPTIPAPSTPQSAVPAPNSTPATSPPGAAKKPTPDEMREALKEVFDPEIPINIVDLGLIYKLDEAEGKVDIEMTLTSPHCPVGDQLKARVTDIISNLNGVSAVNINLVFNPPWTKEKMTFDGKLQASMLGIM